MALLKEFLTNLHSPPVILLKQYLEDGIPEHLQTLTNCFPTDWCRKSTLASTEFRDLGNQSCRSKNYEDALMYYSHSIAFAPTDSEELALAYGNRSAILQVQKEYELCLLDSNRALDGLLLQSSRQKLLERKATAWEKLQEQNFMRSKLKAGISNIKRSAQERANLMSCEKQVCYISNVDIDDTDLVIDRTLIEDSVFEIKFENHLLQNLSPKVQRRVDKEWGQVFIAVDDIEPGEILSNDDFYSLIVEESKVHQFCSYCNLWCKALIPCKSCSLEMYCSVGCREKAYDIYHKIECKMVSLWGNIDTSDRQARRLFLRIFLTGTKQGSDLTALLNNPQVYEALNGKLDYANAQFLSEDYLPILNSVWKLEEDVNDPRNQYIIPEVLEIFIGLRNVKFFGAGETKTQCSGNILTDEELLTTVLLLHNVSIAISLSDATSAFFWESEDGPLKVRQNIIGAAFGPWHIFMNHSCNANVTRVVGGRHVLCRSLRPIKAGEQIFLSNGHCYTENTREERQAEIKCKTDKECSCVACVQNWPTMNELKLARKKYITSNKAIIKNIEKMEHWVQKKYDYSIAEEDLKKVCEFAKTIRKYVKEPSYTIVACERFLRQAMQARGNLYFSQKYIASLYKDM